jgi:hypothetical protein
MSATGFMSAVGAIVIAFDREQIGSDGDDSDRRNAVQRYDKENRAKMPGFELFTRTAKFSPTILFPARP